MPVLRDEDRGSVELKDCVRIPKDTAGGPMTRKQFMTFFLLGGFISLFARKVKTAPKMKKALFWRIKDED